MEQSSNKIENFLQKFEKLYKTGPLHKPQDSYYIKQTFGYALLMKKWDNNPKHDHILIRINKNNLHIHTPQGQIPIGYLDNEFNGLETFDELGPIHIDRHKERREMRMRKLNI